MMSTDPTKLGRPTQIIKLTGDFTSQFFVSYVVICADLSGRAI